MNTRTLFAVVAALGIIMGSGSAAYAWHGGGHGGGYGYNCYGANGNGYADGNGQALTPEKMTSIQNIVRDADKRLQPLMDQYSAKRMELDALSGNVNAKPELISKLAAEIAALQGQIRTEMDNRNEKIAAEGGRPYGGGYGMGRGDRGDRGDRGGRGHRGNYGGHRGGGNCYF